MKLIISLWKKSFHPLFLSSKRFFGLEFYIKLLFTSAVLPKFEVSIEPPPFFKSECEDVRIDATYVFGKAVVGTLKVNLTVNDDDENKIGPTIYKTVQVSNVHIIS